MRISAINYQTNPQFTSDNKKSHKMRNIAGAAAIALATAAPMEEAKGQYYYVPPIPTPPPVTYMSIPYIPTVPNSFVKGDVTKGNSKKTMSKIFNEIDANGNKNGQLSVNEVIRTERKNWNKTNLYPYTNNQRLKTEKDFKELANLYNEDNSNPNTINFREYQAMVKDYLETKDSETLYNIMQILTIPYYYYSPTYNYPPSYYYDRPYHDYYDRPYSDYYYPY